MALISTDVVSSLTDRVILFNVVSIHSSYNRPSIIYSILPNKKVPSTYKVKFQCKKEYMTTNNSYLSNKT